VTARFGEAGSLAPGAAVSVAGVKVGTVSQITLDPKTYMAVARLSLDPAVKLPSDSTAKITSDRPARRRACRHRPGRIARGSQGRQ
jgi:phospholipid/cholesterol/gamma-HCH transport system substrate-binding protein